MQTTYAFLEGPPVPEPGHVRSHSPARFIGRARRCASASSGPGDGVGSGQAALERLAPQAYVLVVCDPRMSDRDGAVVYRTIERQPSP